MDCSRERKLLLQPALHCDIVDRPHHPCRSHSGGHELPQSENRKTPAHHSAVKKESAITRRVNDERRLRALESEYTKCTCGLRDELLQPVGQVLKFTTGTTFTGRAPGNSSESRTVFMPLQLMDSSQHIKYSAVKNVICWWCTYKVKGPVVGCPISHRRVVSKVKNEKIDGYLFVGYFCSWPCARAYGNVFHPEIRDTLGKLFYAVLLFIVRNLRRNGFLAPSCRVPHVKPALHFSVLQKFDGPMTIINFRRTTDIDNSKELTVIPSWFPSFPAGMRVTEAPCMPRRFADEFNLTVIFDEPTHPQSTERWSVSSRRSTMMRAATVIRKTTKFVRTSAIRKRHRNKSLNQIGGNQRPAVNPIQMSLRSHPSV